MEIIPFSVSKYSLETYLVKISTRSRIIYWIIIGMIVTVIAVLPFIYVDVSVQARGYFQSEIEKQIVYTPLQGKIVFSSIHSGDRVTRGDTLLIIDSETIRAQKAALIQRISDNEASILDLEKLTETDSLENQLSFKQLSTHRYKAEFANLRNQQAIQFQKYTKKKTEHERNELLYNQEIIPETDYENSLFVLSSEKDNLNQILLYQKSLWQSDLSMRKNEAVNLLASLEQCTEGLSNRIVLAPTSGEIIQSTDIQSGSIIGQGQKIAEISPDGELVATCFVKPADIGLIKEKQKVKIQVDAFNYSEWGMLQGYIIDISDDMIVENGSMAFFRIKCKPAQTFLSLKNGHKAFIKKGMSLNTRIVVIRRSLYNLLFDKADKWFNPYTYNKE
ncbi:MAG: HlyD family efflux transporter periplasmic adaptor subunit [Bacteroidetes bacterium]|nr:MAG: HlyD family efflux transporter periplasmic adaptor subunit [Bacteroidota bacterium]